jgi:hypothetical protein
MRALNPDQRRDIVFLYPIGHNAAPVLQERVAINSRDVRAAAFHEPSALRKVSTQRSDQR